MKFFVHNNYNATLHTFGDNSTFSTIPSHVAVIADSSPTGYTQSDSIVVLSKLQQYVCGLYPCTIDYVNFRKFMVAMVESKVGVDYSHFDHLSPEEAIIACEWCNIRIAKELGLSQYYVLCGSRQVGDVYINLQLKNAATTRKARYIATQTIYYNTLGRLQGLLIERDIREKGLKDAFIDNGVQTLESDGVAGIADFFMSTTPFEANGLLTLLQNGTLAYSGDARLMCQMLNSIIINGYI